MLDPIVSEHAHAEHAHADAARPAAPGRARPPLSKRQRRAAVWAGILSLLFITAGLIAIAGMTVVAFFIFVVMGVRGPSGVDADGSFSFTGLFLSSMSAGTETVGDMFVVFMAGGGALIAVGVLAGWLVVRRARVHRAGAVAWSASGISTLVVLVLAAGIVVVSNESVKLLPVGGWQAFWVYLVLFIVVTLAGVAAVGSLTWWWMAHAWRARADS